MVDADREELRRYREEEERGLLLHLPVPLGAAVWRVREPRVPLRSPAGRDFSVRRGRHAAPHR